MAIRLIKSVKKIQAVIIRRASSQDQSKQKQSLIKIGNNRPSTTIWQDGTPEQTNKVIILG